MTSDSIQRNSTARARPANRTGAFEGPFWNGIGATWRQIAGGMKAAGFSFEYHEWEAGPAVDWSDSFHPQSVEICLNLEGIGWVVAGSNRMEFQAETAGFFGCNGATLLAKREAGQRHRFLSVEFSVEFLKSHLSSQTGELHPLVRDCVAASGVPWGFPGSARSTTGNEICSAAFCTRPYSRQPSVCGMRAKLWNSPPSSCSLPKMNLSARGLAVSRKNGSPKPRLYYLRISKILHLWRNSAARSGAVIFT